MSERIVTVTLTDSQALSAKIALEERAKQRRAAVDKNRYPFVAQEDVERLETIALRIEIARREAFAAETKEAK